MRELSSPAAALLTSRQAAAYVGVSHPVLKWWQDADMICGSGAAASGSRWAASVFIAALPASTCSARTLWRSRDLRNIRGDPPGSPRDACTWTRSSPFRRHEHSPCTQELLCPRTNAP